MKRVRSSQFGVRRGKNYYTGVTGNNDEGTPLRRQEGERSVPSTIKEGTDGRYANGDIDCPSMHKRIDPTICSIAQWRYPKGCEGCKYTDSAASGSARY